MLQRMRFWLIVWVMVMPFSIIGQVSETERSQFEQFLNEHPFSNKPHLTPKELKKLPKNERPDYAYEQDYLRTLDPTTGKPEWDKLIPMFQQTSQPLAPVQGIPGSNSFPWVERGPDNIGGRTRALMWDPNATSGNKVWAGGVTGGLWYNNDITSPSSQWQAVNNFWDNIAVTCIAYDPNNTQVMYVGTGESFTGASRGAGIWKTINGGTNWAQISSTSNFFYVNDIVVRNESGTSVVYAAVDGRSYQGVFHGAAQAGLQRSTNGGTSWTQVLPNIPSTTRNFVAADIEIAADNRLWIGSDATPYAATDRGGGRVLFSDNGTSWFVSNSVSVTNGRGRVEVACAPSDANTIYALVENNSQLEAILRTTNKGFTWENSSTSANVSEPNDDDNGIPATDFTRGQAFYDLIAAVDPLNEDRLIIGGINLHRSNNGGQTWQQISKWSNNPNMGAQNYSYVHADQHAIVFKPGQTGFASQEVIFGTDGGVFWSNSINNAPFQDVIDQRNNGYNVTQFYAVGQNPTAGSNHIIGGTQDNGTQEFTSSGMNSTTEKTGGDGAFCFVDQNEPNIQIASYVFNTYTLYNGIGGPEVGNLINDLNSGSFINVADYDNNQNALYTYKSSSKLYKVTNISTSSTGNIDSIVHNFGSRVTALKVSPYTNGSTKLFVGTSSGRLFRINSANGNAPQVTEITPTNFPTGSISSIEFGASENEMLVTFFNYGISSIWYSSNGGTSFSDKEGTGTTQIPDMPIRWGMINPNNANEVILATEVGVWSTANFLATNPDWSASSSGLANVRVDMFQLRTSDNEVVAATHGRGMFTSSAFNNTSGINLIMSSIQPNCGGNTGSLTINVTGGTTPYSYLWSTGDSNATILNLGAGSYSVTVTDSAGALDSLTETLTAGSSITSLPYNESFENTFGDWYNDTLNDDQDWIFDNNGTLSGGTGPGGPIDGFQYIRIEASNLFPNFSQPGDKAYLISKCADFSNAQSPFIAFYNHQFSQTSNPTLTLEADSGNGIWNNLFSQTGDQGNLWNADTIMLPSYAGKSVVFRFTAEVGTSGSTFQGDISLDKVYISGSAPLLNSFTINQPSCNSSILGNISVSSTGGSGNTTYQWSTGDTTNQISNLAGGVYAVSIFDNGALLDTNTFHILSTTAPSSYPFNTSFEGSFDGFYNLGTNQEDWFIATGNAPTFGTGPTGADEGTFYLRIESSLQGAGGSAAPGEIAEIVTPCLDLSVTNNPFVSYAKHQFSQGNNNPVFAFFIDTANGNWIQLKSDTGNFGNAWTQDTFDLTNFSGGSVRFKFLARVADQGLPQRSDIAIDNFYFEPYPLLEVSASLTQGNCFTSTTGAINLTTTGGIPPYSYVWNTGDTTSSLSNLQGGFYEVTVTDQAGQNEVFSSGMNGSQALQSFPYNEGFEGTYGFWLNEGTGDDIDWEFDTDGTPSLGTGPTAPTQGNSYLRIEGSAPPVGNASPGDIAILNGPCVDLSGATLPYISFDNHQWSLTGGGANPMPNNCKLTLEADSGNGNWFPLFRQAGDQGNQWNSDTVFLNQYIGQTLRFRFIAKVADTGSSNFRSDIALDKLFLTLHDPVYLLSSNVVEPSCGANDGLIKVNIDGGQTPYSYIWSNGAVTDSISNLFAGTYSVTVTDIFSQTFDTTFQIGSYVGSFPAAHDWETGLGQFEQEQTNDVFDWTIQSGGTPSGNTGPSFANKGSFYIYTEASGPRVSGDSAILYSPCIDLSNLPSPIFTLESHQLGNSNMSIEILADSGNGIWNSIFFSQGNQGNQWNQDTVDLYYYIDKVPKLKFIGTVATQGAGQFNWQGDNAIDEVSVQPGQPLQFTSLNVIQPTCNNSTDGEIEVFVSGGYKPYKYSWTGTSTATNLGTNLSAGNFQVTISDKYGRFIDTTIALSGVGNISISKSIFNVDCKGNTTGGASLNVSGGITPYSFVWSGASSTTNGISNVSAGKYLVTITDSVNCQTVDSVIITEPDSLLISNTITPVLCKGDSTGAVSANITGGTMPYNISWSTGSNSNSISGLTSGSYSIIVIDSNFCSTNDLILVPEPTLPLVLQDSAIDESCPGAANGVAGVLATGGVPPYTYAWPAGVLSNQPIANGLTSGSYTVSVTDSVGCIKTATINISAPAGPNVSFDSVPDFCLGSTSPVTLVATPVGGVFSGPSVLGNIFDPTTLAIGSYTLRYVFSDTAGCTDSASQIVNIDAAPSVSLFPIASLCQNAPTFTLSGGTPAGGIYSINGIQATLFDPSALPVGNYNIKYEISNQCGTDSSVVQSSVLNTPFANAGANQAIAAGTSTTLNGSINAATLNGVGSVWFPDTLVINPFSLVTNTTNLLQNTSYILFAVDTNTGCSSSDTTLVSVSTVPLTVILSSSQDSVCIGSSVTLNAAAVGGTGNYTYAWTPSGGLTNPSANATSANITGTTKFFITVSDGLASIQDSILVTGLSLPSVAFNFQDTFCINEPALALSGGTPLGGFYAVNGFTATNFDPSNVGLGTQLIAYSFSNSFGCTNTVNKQVEVVSSPSVSFTTLNDVCSNDIPISLSSGTPSGGFYSGTGVSNNTFSPAITGAGNFAIKYTYAVGGCSDSATQNISVNQAPSVFAGNDTTITTGNFVSLSPAVSGNNLNYLWSPSASVNQANSANTNSITLTSTTALNLLVTDTVTNCSSTDDILITAVGGTLNVNASAPQTSICLGDSVQLSALASGGTGTYTYQWNNGGFLNQSNVFNPIASPTTTTQFSVTVSDGVSNTVASLAINVNALPTVSLDPYGPFCDGDTLQNLPTGVPSGGTYSGNGVIGNLFSPTLAGAGITLLSYSYTDINGCTNTAAQNVLINSKPVVTLSGIPSFCSNDQNWPLLQGVPLGGSYSGNGVINGVFDPAVGQGIYPIVYQYTDTNGCSDTANYNVSVNDAPSVDAGINQSVPLGFNTTLFGTAASTSGQLGVSWNPSNLLVTPTVLSPNTIGMIQSTQFTLTVLDSATGCLNSDQMTVSVTGGPLGVNLLVSNDTICEGDSITLNTLITGGSGPTMYKWNTTALTDTTIGNPKAAPSLITTYIVTVFDTITSVSDTITVLVNASPNVSLTLPNSICDGDGNLLLNQGLPIGGAYAGPGIIGNSFDPILAGPGAKTITYTLTDANGCSGSDTEIITVNTSPMVTLNLTDDTTCQDGNSLLLSGGLPIGGTYEWLGNQNSLFNPSGLLPGIYTASYEVMTPQGCSGLALDSIYVSGAPQISLLALNDVACNGDTTGSIVISIAGGTNPITTNWSNGSSTQNLSNVPSGTYSVLAQDVSGCFSSKSYTVNQPQPINISFNSLDVLCAGDQTGQAFANISGGNSPFTLNWSNGKSSNLIDSLGQGFYSLNLTDLKGCKDSSTVQIFEPQPLSVVLGSQDLTCFQSGDGSAIVNVAGGVSPYNYLWESGSIGKNAQNLSAGFQSITVTDSNACTLIDSVNITQPAKINIGASAIGSPSICVGGTVFLSANPVSYPIYQWKLNGINISGANTLVYQASLGGNYAVQAADSNGCKATSGVVQVQILPPPTIQFTGVSSNYCENQDSIALSADPPGGVFKGASVSNNILNANALGLGSYQIQYAVTDTNGCSDSSNVRVNIRPQPVIGSLLGATMVQPNNTYTYALNATNGSQYKWLATGGSIISTTNNLATIQWGAPGSGEISVVETNFYGCLDTADFFISIGVQIGQNELGDSKELSVYPNPVSDNLFLKLTHAEEKTLGIQLISPTGSVVFNKSTTELNLMGGLEINVSNFSSGVYFLKLTGEDLNKQIPVVIQ